MARRSKTKIAASPVVNVPSVVRAIFNPAGYIHVRAVSPSGNVYVIAPRVSFQIATEDVDWFFHEWDWQHRQCLVHEKEYRPRQAQFNNGRQIEDRLTRPPFDNGLPAQESTNRVPEPAVPALEESITELAVPTLEESITAFDSIETENNEGKE